MPQPNEELTLEQALALLAAADSWINDLHIAISFQILSAPNRAVVVPRDPGILEGQALATEFTENEIIYRLIPESEVDSGDELAAIEEYLEVLPPGLLKP